MDLQSLQACPEGVTSLEGLRAAIGVGLVPNLPSSQRPKSEENTASDKTGKNS